MEKKYKTKLDPRTGLLRIVALKDFSDVKRGNSGGLIEKEDNLSQEGDCWVYGNARVEGNAKVYDNARVFGDARVYGNARVYGEAAVYGGAYVCGEAEVYGNAQVFGDAYVVGNAKVYGSARVYGEAKVCGNVKLHFSDVAFSINDSKDYIIFGTKNKFRTFLNNGIKNYNKDISGQNYLKNIKTIRQLYGKEI